MGKPIESMQPQSSEIEFDVPTFSFGRAVTVQPLPTAKEAIPLNFTVGDLKKAINESASNQAVTSSRGAKEQGK